MNKIILFGVGAAVVFALLCIYLNLTPSDEEIRMDMIDEFREHGIYKKFKLMYPNSIESYSLYQVPSLDVRQSDNHNNTLHLMILKGEDIHPYYYHVICLTDRWKDQGGVPFEAAFDFLDDNNCLQDYP